MPRPPEADGAFGALADRTRRAVIIALTQRPTSAGDLARELGVSPPALSRHLRVLRRAGIVAERGASDDARVRVYHMAPDALAPVRQWLAELEGFWSEQLAAFKVHAESRAARTAPRGRRPE